MSYPLRPFTIPLWRMTHIERQRSPFSGEGARLFGGRWNAKGQAALYLALDHATAVAEFYQGFAKPGTLIPYRMDATAIADLTDGAGNACDERVAAACASDWKAIMAFGETSPPSWTLAQPLIDAGAQGALVPSIQNRGGANLVLWRWHDAQATGDGAALALLDPEAALGAVPLAPPGGGRH